MTSLPQQDAATGEQQLQVQYGIQTQFPMHPHAIRSVTGEEQLQAQQFSITNSDCNSSVGMSMSMSSWIFQEDPSNEVVRRVEQLPSTGLSASAGEVEETVLEEPCVHECIVVPLHDRAAGSEFVNCAKSDLTGYKSRDMMYAGSCLGARAQAQANLPVSEFSFTTATAETISSTATPQAPGPQTPGPQAPAPQAPAPAVAATSIDVLSVTPEAVEERVLNSLSPPKLTEAALAVSCPQMEPIFIVEHALTQHHALMVEEEQIFESIDENKPDSVFGLDTGVGPERALRATMSGHQVQLEGLQSHIQRLELDNVALRGLAIRAELKSMPDLDLVGLFGGRASSDGPATGDCPPVGHCSEFAASYANSNCDHIAQRAQRSVHFIYFESGAEAVGRRGRGEGVPDPCSGPGLARSKTCQS